MEDLEEIKTILGSGANKYPDEELMDSVIKMKYLIELWLDSFEKDIFEGKSLAELLSSRIL